MGLYHPLDGITNPKFKLLHFLTFFCREKKELAFNRDWCCHLALCLRLILFHLLVARQFRQFWPDIIDLDGEPNKGGKIQGSLTEGEGIVQLTSFY